MEHHILGKPSLILLEKTPPALLIPLFLHPKYLCVSSFCQSPEWFCLFVCVFVFYDGLFISLPPPMCCYIFSKKKDHPLLFLPCDYHKALPMVGT